MVLHSTCASRVQQQQQQRKQLHIFDRGQPTEHVDHRRPMYMANIVYILYMVIVGRNKGLKLNVSYGFPKRRTRFIKLKLCHTPKVTQCNATCLCRGGFFVVMWGVIFKAASNVVE